VGDPVTEYVLVVIFFFLGNGRGDFLLNEYDEDEDEFAENK
jgi:hypothetical protein